MLGETPGIATAFAGDFDLTLQLGQIAPDFEQDTTNGSIRFHEYMNGSWCILFSHPRDFTPVCTTELSEAARLKPEWDKRGVKVIGLSVDPSDSHASWEKDIEETQGQALNFPVIADLDRRVSALYGMVHPLSDPSVTVRSVFIIDPNKKIRLTMTYPASTGRNFQEILRVVDSLQLTDAHNVATPANWKDGDKVIIVPSLSDADAKRQFPNGWTALTPHLRIVDQPKPTRR
jgi:thioredoxin-dependent peroxiredoxin